MSEAERQARLLRALREGPAYQWVLDPDGPFWRVHTTSGGCYEVGLQGECCDCWSAVRGECKHSYALMLGLGTYVESWQGFGAGGEP